MHKTSMSAAALACVLTAAAASAQTVPAATVLPGVTAPCALSTRVRQLDDTHTLYAVSLRSWETGRGSGIVALWAGDRRYDVAFRNLVTLDTRDVTTPDTAVVVRFPVPTALDGAVVTSLEEGVTTRSCEPWFSPWVSTARMDPARLTREQRRLEEQVLAGARAAAIVDAPAAIGDPRPCTTPDRTARTTYAVEPEMPRASGGGLAVVLVLLDTSDHLISARIQRSAGDPRLDAAALGAARGSEFQGQTFRCRRVIGGYLFSVQFNP